MSLQLASRTTETLFQPRHVAVSRFPAAARKMAARGEIEVQLEMRHAGTRAVTLRYERVGDPSLPVLFVAGGISANRHVGASDQFSDAGWWQEQSGPGRALDPAQHCILAFDWVGGDGTLDAVIDPVDQATAVVALLDALGIARLSAFIGNSYGAMVGLHLAALHPRRVGRLVAISGFHRAHPYASAWRALQRRAVALGALQCDDSQGVALARQLAMLSYRTADEFDSRFGAAKVVNGRVQVAAEDYLDHCGQQFADRVAAQAFVRLSESIDLQAVDPETVQVPVTVVAVAEDLLVPLADAYDLVQRLRGETRLHVIHSRFGHDAFLKESRAIDGILREALLDIAADADAEALA
ncbi:homoserine O-succinyltransferase [Lysobacter ciconiae]|uniref:Homoserine O-succinyltransferase n=1 Tax=Novilysobacter ciconiae TaxID=2781022 RepID=A0A7S6ZRT1_9GAMM|nr:homoserine O-succinyltransferase [Lysobacter ciconiae]